MLPVERLRQHVEELARAFGVRVHFDATMKPDEAAANGRYKVVRCHPVIDETTYCVALHELGHCCAPLGSLVTEKSKVVQRLGTAVARAMGLEDERDLNLRYEEEVAAWEWARRQALVWTDLMDNLRAWAFKTHEDGIAAARAQLAATACLREAATREVDAAREHRRWRSNFRKTTKRVEFGKRVPQRSLRDLDLGRRR